MGLEQNINSVVEIFSQYDVSNENPIFRIVMGILLSQRDAGEMVALTMLFRITGRVRGQSVPSDTDGGNETARRSSLGQEKKKKQAQRNAKKICMRCRLALLPTRC